jgi:TonB family protein
MIRIAAFLALSLFAAGAAAQPSAPPDAESQPGSKAPARARANLASLFSDEDYPTAALRNHEQGAVAFRIDVGADGSPTGCSVTGSSGSALLDATTCRLLMERARFEPARDSRGRPTADHYSGRIVWRLPPGDLSGDVTEAPPGLLLWNVCVSGEAAKLVPGDLPPAEVARRAFGPCTALEVLAQREPGAAPLTPERREALIRMIEANVVTIRERLKPPAKASPDP